MRIAILSDIHGNALALRTVLADIATRGGVDGYWLLGDFLVMGPHPAEVLEILLALPNASFIHGNTDSYMRAGVPFRPSFDSLKNDPAELNKVITFLGAQFWAQGAVTALGQWPWLNALPLEHRAILPDGTRVLCVHASPGTDDGAGIGAFTSDSEITALLGDCAESLIFVGHTHMPLDRSVLGKRVVNPGSVSHPAVADLGAKYALLEASPAGHHITLHSVDYDREQVLADCTALKFPGSWVIGEFLRGQRVRKA